ncbi:hypothetical protein [Bradyrhizobium sp. AZCC 2230]|uniref:hypothetical protein n=1 Tax=Bradyrhizobium sp. AZCC 2230 TaxID=3117021 RepID=UPI002FF02D41
MSIPTSQADCAIANGHPSGSDSRCWIVAMLCATSLLAFTPEAWGQCSAREVLQNQLKLGKIAPVHRTPKLIRSVRDVSTWRTIAVGTFPDPLALRSALDAAGCNIGGLASEVLARPAFTVSSSRTNVELVAVSAVELGFETDTVTLAAVYTRARQLGFELAPAEVGPQLRLQYLDQPMGEFLVVAMEPIRTWSHAPIVLNVANGGAGLILIGQDGRDDAEIPVTSRFVFARPNDRGPSWLDTATAHPPP